MSEKLQNTSAFFFLFAGFHGFLLFSVFSLMTNSPDIRIGTMAGKGLRTAEYISKILPHGFESFEIQFPGRVDDLDLPALAKEVAGVLKRSDAIVSCIAIYGNPLGDEPKDALCREGWLECIENAHHFGTDLVCGFSGRVRGKPIPDSIPRLKEVFTPLLERAQKLGVRIAFENCPMGGDWRSGDWNIAINPSAWELMFEALPFDNLGLEWEPCHQMCQLIDPMPQLRKYAKRIFHIHGKDAKVLWDVVEREGIIGPNIFAFHKHPGLGDSNWTRIIEELRKAGFRGSIDIEGWHDDVYKGELEMTGQVHALNYLRACRLNHVANPEGF